MSLAAAAITLVLLAAVIAIVGAPLRTGGTIKDEGPPGRGELEVAREAKYREIRDLELDYRTGKLSDEDYQAIDGVLRAEAVEILNQLGEPR